VRVGLGCRLFPCSPRPLALGDLCERVRGLRRERLAVDAPPGHVNLDL